MAVPDVPVTIDALKGALISVCQFMDKVQYSSEWDRALDDMDLNDVAFEEELDVIRAFIGYDPDDVMGSGCARCGSDLDPDTGLCEDETCPFHDHAQTCPAGWYGHPTPAMTGPCNCKKEGDVE